MAGIKACRPIGKNTIERFASARRFASYAGGAPGVWASAEKVFASYLCSNVNRYLRWALVETVIHYTQACPWAQAKYRRLKRAKGWKTARLAVARHVAAVVYHVLKERRAYRDVFVDRQAGMAGIKACRLCRPIGKNIGSAGAGRPPAEI